MPKFGIRTLYCCVLLSVNHRFKRSQTSGVAGGVVVADKQLCVLPIVQQWAGYVMVGKVADHEYLLVVQCAGVGVNLFIVGQQQGVVTVDEGLVRLAQRQQAAVEAVHRVWVAHLFGGVDLWVVGVQRYPRCAGGKACIGGIIPVHGGAGVLAADVVGRLHEIRYALAAALGLFKVGIASHNIVNGVDAVEMLVRHAQFLTLINVGRSLHQVEADSQHFGRPHTGFFVLGAAEARHHAGLVVVVPVQAVPRLAVQTGLPAGLYFFDIRQLPRV